MTSKCILFLALASLFAIQIGPASACRVVGHTSDGEPLCMTTSDGAGQEFTDDRQRTSRWDWARQRATRAREASRIAEMRSGGTMIGGILVSPYVPGSNQDKAWQAERRQRGFIP
jgi:hypothetical protein